jgi:hypothetical protein
MLPAKQCKNDSFSAGEKIQFCLYSYTTNAQTLKLITVHALKIPFVVCMCGKFIKFKFINQSSVMNDYRLFRIEDAPGSSRPIRMLDAQKRG